jgi:hypothetical protein
MEYANVAKVYIVADHVILDLDMLHLGVEDVVLGEAGSGFVVTIYGGTCATTECKAIQELSQEYCFVGRIVKCNIFCIAGGVCYETLFAGRPGDHAGAEAVAMATDGMTGVFTVSIIGIRVSK